MQPEEREQQRAAFEATLTELTEEEKTTKLSEWDTQNPVTTREPDNGEDYRGKLNAQNRFLKEEGYEFKDGKWVKPAPVPSADNTGLSPADIVAIRDLHEDDIPTLQKWAKNEGITLAEARKDKDLGIILAARAEDRRTAEAAHTTGGSRGAKKPSGADLLDKALRTNEVPDDDEGMAAIAAARQTKKIRPA